MKIRRCFSVISAFSLALMLMLSACGGGGGGGGDDDGTVPSAPTGITATGGDGRITINWDPVSGAASYNIYWSTTSGVTKATGTAITNAARPYTHTGLTNGTTHYYVVTAVNIYGESSESSEVSATPTATPPTTGVWDSSRWDEALWGT